MPHSYNIVKLALTSKKKGIAKFSMSIPRVSTVSLFEVFEEWHIDFGTLFDVFESKGKPTNKKEYFWESEVTVDNDHVEEFEKFIQQFCRDFGLEFHRENKSQ